jgi:hypothetical protein
MNTDRKTDRKPSNFALWADLLYGESDAQGYPARPGTIRNTLQGTRLA